VKGAGKPLNAFSTLEQEKEVYLSKAKKLIPHNAHIINTIEQSRTMKRIIKIIIIIILTLLLSSTP